MQVEALLLKEGNHLVHHTIHTYSDRNFGVRDVAACMHVHSVCILNACLNLVTSQTTIIIAIDVQPKSMLFAQCGHLHCVCGL